MDAGDGGHGAGVQRREEVCQEGGPGQVLFPGGVAPIAHPAQVGPGAEGGPGAGEEDGTYVAPGGDGPQGAQEGFREGPIEGVAAPGPVQAQLQHASREAGHGEGGLRGSGRAPE